VPGLHGEAFGQILKDLREEGQQGQGNHREAEDLHRIKNLD